MVCTLFIYEIFQRMELWVLRRYEHTFRAGPDYTFTLYKPCSFLTSLPLILVWTWLFCPFLKQSWHPSSSILVFIAGSSSFESQKMERPSLNVLSPSSPGMLQDAPQLMPGQLSVSVGTLSVLGCWCVSHEEEASDLFVCFPPRWSCGMTKWAIS